MGVTVARPTATFRTVYDRLAARPAWAVCVLCIAGSALATTFELSVSPTVRYAPLAASVVVFGLPHGAVDYLVPARVAGRSTTASMAVIGVLYAALGGAYAALWLFVPTIAAALFIAVTWFHWGQGDVHALVAFVDADHLDSTALRAVTGVVRGGLPMFVPLLAFPNRYRTVVETWVGLFGSEFSVAWLFAMETRILGGGLFFALTVATLAVGYRRNASHGWRVDAGETALLWVFFLTVPPLVAIGVYFCVWHSLRHVFRVVSVDGGEASNASRHSSDDTLDGRNDTRVLFGRFARDAAPLTALALVFLVGFGLSLPVTPRSPAELLGTYLVFIAVLTLPHVAVVTWMDRREGVWTA